jgi:hypothetical protein
VLNALSDHEGSVQHERTFRAHNLLNLEPDRRRQVLRLAGTTYRIAYLVAEFRVTERVGVRSKGLEYLLFSDDSTWFIYYWGACCSLFTKFYKLPKVEQRRLRRSTIMSSMMRI